VVIVRIVKTDHTSANTNRTQTKLKLDRDRENILDRKSTGREAKAKRSKA
jgi:hypothetical protein